VTRTQVALAGKVAANACAAKRGPMVWLLEGPSPIR
jgi:hypothetical protein